MTTVKEVLERLGPPPPSEVCWDWGFQLLQLYPTQPHRMWPPADGRVSPSTQTWGQTVLPAWSLLTLDASGVLHASYPHERLTSAQVDELLEQLTEWAEFPRSLSELPSSMAKPDTIVGKQQPLLATLEVPGPTQTARSQRRPRQPATLRHATKPMTVVLAVGLGCAALWGFFLSPSNESRRGALSVAELPPTPPSDLRDEAPSIEPNIEPGIEPQSDVDEATQDTELSLLTTAPDTSVPAETPALSELALATNVFSEVLEPVRPATPAAPGQAPAPNAADQSAEPAVPQTVAAIMDEVSRMVDVETTAAASQPLDRLTSTPDEPHPALALPLFPPTRLITLADKLRLREPQWLLRLEAAPEFRVLPSDPQVLSARQSLTWEIQPAVPPSAATCPASVIVQVDSVSPRKAALRWRVAAVAEDLPRLLFPMDSHMLDVLRRRLKEHLQWLESQQQLHRQATRNASLPNEVRSALVQQRQFVQEQLSLAQRSMQIVSEAAQLLAGLDGQLDLHVSLHESGEDARSLLLQLGSP